MSYSGGNDPTSTTVTEKFLAGFLTTTGGTHLRIAVRKLLNNAYCPPEHFNDMKRLAFELISEQLDPKECGIQPEDTKYIDWEAVFSVFTHFTPKSERAGSVCSGCGKDSCLGECGKCKSVVIDIGAQRAAVLAAAKKLEGPPPTKDAQQGVVCRNVMAPAYTILEAAAVYDIEKAAEARLAETTKVPVVTTVLVAPATPGAPLREVTHIPGILNITGEEGNYRVDGEPHCMKGANGCFDERSDECLCTKDCCPS